jgi:hypothetical protein
MSQIAPISALLVLAVSASAATAATPQDRFLERLRGFCGQTLTGKMVTNDPADTAFQAPIQATVACTPDEVRIPVAVGADRSRTWIVRRTASGLSLKHDHRHADGTPDVISNYGGETAAPGTAERQDFPVDAFSKDLFTRENRQVSLTNVWSVDLSGGGFAYELNRPNRHFRIELAPAK